MDEALIVAFGGAMTEAAAADVRRRLLDAISDNAAVLVDCSGLTRVDECFVHILSAARVGAEARGIDFRLSPPAAGVLLELLHRTEWTAEEWRFWGVEPPV
jgi:anti-anti-sigma regulatory factor